MAQTIRIEIPITAKDNTGGATKAVEQKLNSLEKAYQRMQKQLQKLSGKHFEIDLDANDHVTSAVADAEAAVTHMDGHAANVDVTADDQATDVINDVQGALSSADGDAANLEIDADDAATTIIEDADDALADIDGDSASLYVEADDAATDVIESVESEASNLDGSIYQITISAIDLATTPITGILNLLRNPLFSLASTLGVGFGVGDSINTYNNLEGELSHVQAISGATANEMSQLSEQARALGASTKFTSLEVAEGYSYMGMAGWSASQMMAGLPSVLALSSASGESLSTTSDIVTDALSAFGLTAEDTGRFADVLAQASADANTNVGMMGESFKYVAPIAGAMVYSVEDTALALATMANSGIKSSMAGTTLRRALSNLAAPTDKVATAMGKYGISLTDTEGNAKPLIDVLDNVRESLGGLDETEQTAAASAIFGTQAMSGMLAIVNASEEDWDALTESIYNSEGAAQAMADTMLDNTVGALTIMQSALSAVKDTLGERLSPYVRSFAEGMTEWLPSAGNAIDEFMDTIDIKTGQLKDKLALVMASETWKNSGIAGKANQLWDTVVADPFNKWASTKGGHAISKGISTLFSEAGKILPGGEEASLTSYLSAGVLAMGASATAKGIMGLTEAFSAINPVLGASVGIFSAAAVGVGALAVAVDAYQQKMIEADLSERFGSISLSAQQAFEVANSFFDTEMRANVKIALGQLTGADEVRSKAEAALAQSKALEWKSKVGLVLSEDEQTAYSGAVETFISSKRSELESQFSGTGLAIQTVIDSEKSTGMLEALSSWYAEDTASLDALSSQLSEAVSAALTDGIIDADESAAIDALEQKINNILSSWNEGKSKTQLDMIKLKYGHLTGADLTSGTFSEIMADYQAQRETAEAENLALSEQLLDMVNSANGAGRLTDAEAQTWRDEITKGFWGSQGESLMQATGFGMNTLNDVYGDVIARQKGESATNAANVVSQIESLFGRQDQYGNLEEAANLQSTIENGFSMVQGGGDAALASLYKTMSPDVNAMGSLIDQYRQEFGQAPQNLIDAYNEAVELGAAAGDTDATWQQYANSLLQNGSDELVNAFTDPSNPLYSSMRSMSPELASAIDRALTEGGEEIELTDMMAKVEELKVDASGADVTSESGAPVEIPVEEAEATLDGDIDASGAYDEAASEVEEAFSDPVPVDPEVEADFTQTNNADEVYDEAASEVKSKFGQTISASGSVAITLDWHITNPTASISVGVSGGSATATISGAAMNASGGYIGSKILSWLGEEGPEYVIPTSGRYRDNGVNLWMQAGEDLGMFSANADGAYVDGGKESEGNIWSTVGNGPVSKDSGTGNVSIGAPKVAPIININGANMSAEEIMKAVGENLSSLADDISNEMAEKLAKIFGNMPLTQEA